ncbi:MAG: hypothetical protein IIZ92_14490 [Aquincola sp.]|nr:hypothetical protein [Aquincola sp.]
MQPASLPARLVAAVLLQVSRRLARAARSLALSSPRPRAPRQGDPVVEFYAEAGAPEGALYVDGQRVGTLHGVSRL